MSVPQNGVITRQRLLELGDGATPITLISAPAGYGKTTLLRQWAPVSGSVVRLDPAEIGDGWELWHQVDEALRLADVTVILDDVHLLDSGRKTSELKRTFDLASSDRRLVIATRRDPILELHDARLAGNVLEIRADDLAFDEAETRLFLAMNHITATPQQARALWVYTEGWPAGLRLSTTPLSRAAGSQEAFATLLHGDTAVGSYLMGQALSCTSEELRSFLLQTSVTEFLDASLAQELTGRSDAALLLELARSQPGFLHRLSGGLWPYRYHPMFRALLLAELMRSAPEDARRLSAVAAAWFLGHGEHIRAATLAAQGEVWDVLAGALLEGSCVALATGDWIWVKTELDRLPQLLKNSDLDVRLSSALMKVGTGARIEAMALVSGLLRTPPPTQTRRQAEVRRFLESWLMAELGHQHQAISILDIGPDDLAPASGSASGALRSSWQQLQAACLFGDGSPARIQAMLDNFATSSTEPYTRAELGELEIRAWTSIVAGDLHTALQELDRAAAIVDRETGSSRSDFSGTSLSAWRWLELETGVHPPPLLSEIPPGRAHSVFPLPIRRALETITDARVRLVRDSDYRGSSLMLDELISLQPQVRQWWSTAELWTLVRIEAHLAAGEFSSALELGLQSPSERGIAGGTLNDSYLWTWVMQRAALSGGPGTIGTDPDRLVANLPIESQLLPGRSEAMRMRVLLAAASLAFRAGTPDRASHFLRLALGSTEIHHWRRPYEEIASAIAPVLEAERRRISTHGAGVIMLLDQLGREPVWGGRLADPLSVRELEILQYLPTPLDQRELCSALFISRNTLKTHLRSTYRKLGVQTRREAVLQAERLGIL